MSIFNKLNLKKIKVDNREDTLDWNKPFEILRSKWFEVPAGNTRIKTSDLAYMPDHEFLDFWKKIKIDATSGSSFNVRGWYHNLYLDSFKNKNLMDFGSGLGIDGITFAQNGANVTFVDIAQSNLEVLKRLCDLLGLTNVEFLYLEEFESIKQLPKDFDVIWCQGSMINLPLEIAAKEAQILLSHLRIGGRWIELAYPEERWVKEGKMPFNKWGEKTDGEGTPWIEWYDLDKLLQRLNPAQFDVILNFNFYDNDFNWFDLLRTK
jgi:methyltransferase family protein